MLPKRPTAPVHVEVPGAAPLPSLRTQLDTVPSPVAWLASEWLNALASSVAKLTPGTVRP